MMDRIDRTDRTNRADRTYKPDGANRPDKPTADELKHHLRVEPYPYQREGILYGLDRKRLIIGDEPGLGKTLQSIGIVDTAGAYPCLVICPSSLKINWQREFGKFTDKSALVLDNSVRTTWPYLLRMGMHQVAVVNYESLRKYFVWDVNGSNGRTESSGSSRRTGSSGRPDGGALSSETINYCHESRNFIIYQ